MPIEQNNNTCNNNANMNSHNDAVYMYNVRLKGTVGLVHLGEEMLHETMEPCKKTDLKYRLDNNLYMLTYLSTVCSIYMCIYTNESYIPPLSLNNCLPIMCESLEDSNTILCIILIAKPHHYIFSKKFFPAKRNTK